MNNRRNKQNKIVYMCLIVLLVTASVLVAVASGAGKRAGSGNIPRPSTESEQGSTPATGPYIQIPDESASGESKEADVTEPETAKPKESEKTEDVIATEQTEAAELTVNDIVFVSPAKGAVLIPCSATPIYSITMNDYRIHEGVDITAQIGDPVVACADGIIAEVWDDPMMGKSVRLTHASGVESVYQNLADETAAGIEAGKQVSAGELIGAVGDTALIECEEESHLHFELKVDGVDTDPLKYMAIPTLSEEFEG